MIIYLSLFFAIVANVIRVIFRIINTSSRISTSKGFLRGDFTELERQSMFTLYIMEIVYDCAALIANFLVVCSIDSSYSITKWPFLVFMLSDYVGMHVKIEMFSTKFLSIYKRTQIDLKKVKEDAFIRMAEGIFPELDIIKLLNICIKGLISLNCIIMLCVARLQLIEMLRQDIVIKEYIIFVNSLSSIALLGSCQVVDICIACKKRYSWLEYFERKIFLESLDTKTIKQTLKTEYLNNIPFEMFYYIESKDILGSLEEKA